MTIRLFSLGLFLLLIFGCGTENEADAFDEDPHEKTLVQEDSPPAPVLERPKEEPPAPKKSSPPSTGIAKAFRSDMLQRVNAIRAEGCRCGDRLMPPAPPLKWNNQLAQAALGHARDMETNNFLGTRK